jgi:hypothetical protein
MRAFYKIFLVIFFLVIYMPEDSHARILAPGGDDTIGTNPEPFTDKNRNGKWDSDDGTGHEEPYYDYNKNGQWDADSSPDVRNMTYSATWDAAFPNVVCLYNRLESPPKLVINKFFITDSSKVLFGIDDPGACPLPGRKIFVNYPNSIAGEFLISGVICVVNTIIFDSMFKVYCTIILWFYNILYSMIIIYVMFYGLSIMLGIGNDPIREAPKRIFKVVLIFFFAVNAQFGFRFIHNGFLSALNGFTDMLTDIQPYYSEQGHPAYQKSFVSSLAASLTLNIIDGPGKLLDEAGNVWKPVAAGQEYFYPDAADGSYHGDRLGEAASVGGTVNNIQNYVPFRTPAQQWSYQKSKVAGSSTQAATEYKIFPVFKELGIDERDMEDKKIACVIDVRFDPSFVTPSGTTGALVEYPKCNKNFLPSVPEIAPYGMYGIYQYKNGKLYRDRPPIKDVPVSTAPSRLKDTTDNLTETCETLDMVGAAINLPKTCRKPFQGILGKIDSIFNATVGDDSAKSLGALALAIATWGSGSGILLSLLLMTGIITLFMAFFQLVWTYVTAIMALTFLLMLSPVFVSCALFKITDKFFQGWLSALISYTMQPFLIMAFLFVISNMVSLDTLEELARKEVGNRQKTSTLGETDNVIRTLVPSFLGPLYEKPADFDRNYYTSGGHSLASQRLINADQRETYIRTKGEIILDCWLITKGGQDCPDLYKQKVQISAGNYAKAPLYKRIWLEGKYINSSGVEVDIGKTGILAIAAYRQATGDTEIDEFLTCYTQGCKLRGIDYPSLAGLNSGQAITWDDGDSLLGETAGQSTIGTVEITGREYPVCVENCPTFKPAYDPKKPLTVNPRINVPAGPAYVDERKCPPDANGNATICAPNAECLSNCMEIQNAMEFNYGSLAGAILTWILLNAVTVSFIAKIPALAEGLSKWSSYAPSGMPLGGASRQWDEQGTDAWTQQEKSGFYHGSNLLNLGVASGNPGGIPLLAGALGRLGKVRETLNKDGSITTERMRYDPRKLLGGDKGEAQEKIKVKVVKDLKTILGLGDSDRINTDKTANQSQLNQFINYRPTNRTGMPHSQIWQIIDQTLRSHPNATESQLKQLIQDAVYEQVKPKPGEQNKTTP